MSRVFELRTYVANPGKIDALHARFRDHTRALFTKHGMEMIGFWNPTDGPEAADTLIYLMAYPSEEAKSAAWAAFRADPDWQAVIKKTEADGKLAGRVESVTLVPTDYSQMV